MLNRVCVAPEAAGPGEQVEGQQRQAPGGAGHTGPGHGPPPRTQRSAGTGGTSSPPVLQ